MTTADDILASHFTLCSVPGLIDETLVDGVSGWTATNPYPVLSLMRWSTNDEAKAASSIDQVMSSFREKGRGFDWMTGPRCADAGLLPLLEERGFIQPALDVAAMVKTLSPDESYQTTTGVNVWKVEDAEDARTWEIMARGFDVSSEVGEIFHRAYVFKSERQYTDLYAAAAENTEHPEGVGYLSYIGDGPAVLLRVSSVEQDKRGRGIYASLVQRRLADAAAKGRTKAYVHAYSAESRHALEKLGFETTGELKLHRWRP